MGEGKVQNKRAIFLFILTLGVLVAVFIPKIRDKIRSQNKTGEGVTNDKTIESLPEDFPVYPDAKSLNSWTTKNASTSGISTIWETSSPIDKVAGFYKEELEVKGWKITATFIEPNSSSYSFEKDGLSGFLGVGRGEKGKTVISVALGVK